MLTQKGIPESMLVHSMDLMAVDVKHYYLPPVSRGPAPPQVFMLLLEVQEAWCKDWPLFIQVLARTGAHRAASSASLLNVPIYGTWSDPALNKVQVGCQMCVWISVGFLCISDKWKVSCVADACRKVNTMMLPVAGDMLLLW